jgi:hypothetical protein
MYALSFSRLVAKIFGQIFVFRDEYLKTYACTAERISLINRVSGGEPGNGVLSEMILPGNGGHPTGVVRG